ncbi:hypothetical protein [Microcoleus sp. S13_B4]|uniref:hypothetical protein n=1 Tax=Microcoleus sp. S13_B4 TaxID=3055408 RepID=UPI002FD54D42
MRSSLPVEKPVEKLPSVCGKLYSIARNSFCTKMGGRSTAPAFPQVFHRYLLPISDAQQAVNFFFHSFHRAIDTKIIQ